MKLALQLDHLLLLIISFLYVLCVVEAWLGWRPSLDVCPLLTGRVACSRRLVSRYCKREAAIIFRSKSTEVRWIIGHTSWPSHVCFVDWVTETTLAVCGIVHGRHARNVHNGQKRWVANGWFPRVIWTFLAMIFLSSSCRKVSWVAASLFRLLPWEKNYLNHIQCDNKPW